MGWHLSISTTMTMQVAKVEHLTDFILGSFVVAALIINHVLGVK